MSRNAALFAVMCLVWGLTFLPMKIAGSHVPPVFAASTRFWIAGLLMLAWAGRDALKVPREAVPRLVLTGLLANTGNYALMFWGAKFATSGLSAIVNMATIPIYILLASRVIEGNRIRWPQVLAIALGSAGLGLLFASRAMSGMGNASGDPLELWGLAAVATGTLLYAIGSVLTRAIAGSMPTLTIAAWQTLVGAVGLTVISASLETVTAADMEALIAWPVLPSLATLVIGGSLVGYTIYVRLLRDWGAFRAGLYSFVSPVIAVAAGVIVLSEPFGLPEAAGAVLMFTAAAIALRK